MLKRIKPKAIICHSNPFPEIEGNIIVVDYSERISFRIFGPIKLIYGGLNIGKGMGDAIGGGGGGKGDGENEGDGASSSDDGNGSEGKAEAGVLTGKLDGLTQAERTMVNDLLNQGKNVEIIPRSNLQNIRTPDFKVDSILTELKSLSGTSLNTPVTRITEGFKQGASKVIIDARATGLTADQANTVIARVNGIYGNNIPGKIEIWTNFGIIYGG